MKSTSYLAILFTTTLLISLVFEETHLLPVNLGTKVQLISNPATDSTKPCRSKSSRAYKETTTQIAIDFETEGVASQAEGCEFVEEEVEGELEAECELRNEGSYSYIDQIKLKPCHCEPNDEGEIICSQSGKATCYHEREVKRPSKNCSP